MAIDFEKIKKIDAKGVNVGMIQDSAGNILWRKKYKECSLGLGTYDYSEDDPFAWRPYFSSSFSALLDNNYFHYGDRVDLFQSLDGTRNSVISWYDGNNVNVPERYVCLLRSAAVGYDAKTTLTASFYRNIAAQGLLTEYGKIENQTRINNYDGYATDDKACLVADTIMDDVTVAPSASAWNTLMPKFGPKATFYNQYYDFGASSTSAPSGGTADTLTVKISITNYDGQTSTYTYKITITANCKTLPAVAFSYKTSDSTSATIVTLTNNSSSSFTIKGNKVLNFYRQSCYVRSNGSITGTNTSPFLSVDLNQYASNTYYIPLTAVYPSKGSTNYGFLMDSSGNITNSNKNVADSFCYCTMKFQRPEARFTQLRITYTQSSEVNYDYGQFSKIDKMLCAYTVADATSTGFGASLQHSCKGEDSSVHTITYNISSLKVGTDHFINFKYHKDATTNTGTDTFQISKIEFLEDCEYSFGYDNDLQTYALTVHNYSDKPVTFGWRWFYIEGSSESYLSGGINQNVISAAIPIGGSTTRRLTDFEIPEQSGRILGLFECNGALHMFIQ